MRSWSLHAAVLILLLPVLSGCLGLGPEDDSEEPVTPSEEVWFDAVRGPDEAVELIEQLAGFDGVRVAEIGNSVEGRPIHTVTIGDGPFVLWVMGRLHGNEPTGMEAILLLLELLADPDATLPEHAPAILHHFGDHRELLLERLTFVFVPVGNPDGAAAYTRGNSLGVDLNRVFFAFSQVESQVIREAFWTHRPDGCLDLHNIGPSDNDFEAYGPEGPLLDENLDALMVADSWRAVHELDAQGARASGFNEDYRAPEPLEEHPWPEVYHPGTHDFFCTARGAPGWTPEGSIPSGDNGATDPEFAWSARLHAVTVAASAFGWAGVYAGNAPMVHKVLASTGTSASLTLNVTEQDAGGHALLQGVWRSVAGYADHNLLPVTLSVDHPGGEESAMRTPGTPQWTTTILLEDLEPGTYEVQLESVVPMELQLRAYIHAPPAALASVERTPDGLTITASEHAGAMVQIHLSDVAGPGAWDNATLDPEPARVMEHPGSVHTRSVAHWELTLEPGETTLISYAGLGDEPGPYRFTATSGDRLHMGHATEPRVAHS